MEDSQHRNGFTLIESLVAVGLLAVIGVGTLQIFSKLSAVVRVSSVKVDASGLATEQIEIIRNMPYADVGVVAGIPDGKVPRNQTLTRDNKTFLVTTTIRNVDDPFDGTIGGSPNDLSPADYKLVEISITCQNCPNPGTPYVVTSTVAPKNLETASTNGALFIRVFDANGEPVPNAEVHVENNAASPAIVIDELTNVNGDVQIVDVPPGNEVYEITVTKDGFSSEQTLLPGDPGNPNPTKPHASVLLQAVTQISFAIDRLSSIHIASTTETCTPVSGVDFTISGSKLIGTAPDVQKYSTAQSTDGSGELTINDLEWDTYNIEITDGSYDLQGAVPALSLPINPNSSTDLSFIMKAKNPRNLLVAVKDSATLLPVSGANVRIEKSGTDVTKSTGRGYLGQSDWSGGTGQDLYSDITKYLSDDGNIDATTTPGDIALRNILGVYATSGELVSSTFDTGSPSNFHNITWLPQAQQPETGADAVRFQVATNTDNATWNFLGPDGTAATFYTLAETNISTAHNGDRFFRYKLLLQTADTNVSPIISDISFTFTSDCVPPGQALFDGLDATTYTVTVTKTGYQTFTQDVAIADLWQQLDVILLPE